jgi:RNA polymerase sigma factor for flagellar operon FliA
MPQAATDPVPPAERSDPSEDDLVRAHLPLVQYLVHEVAGRVPRHVSRDELVSAGLLGLAQAARAYDPARSVSFSRFASSRIRGALLDELRSRDWASRSVRARARALTEATDRLTGALGRPPTTTELAEQLGTGHADLEQLRADLARSVVLALDGLPGDTLRDVAPTDETPEEALAERESRAVLVAGVAHLPRRLRRVVLGYFVEELPMRVLADELGVTESRISQMRSEALALLKGALEAHERASESVLTLPSAGSAKAARYRRAVAAGDPRRRLDPAAGSLTGLAAACAS